MKRNLKTTHIALLLVISLCAGAVSTVAQTTDATRLKDEIDRNAQLLQEARELVAETNSIKARNSLSIATMLHKESIELYNAGAGGGNLLRAAQTAQKAREAILQTISLAKRETRLEESATKAIERAGYRLEQGRQLLQDSNRDAAAPRQLLEEAHGQLQRARHNMREHLYESALRLAVSSEELSARAIAIIKRDVTDVEFVDHELEKTDRVIERFAEQLADASNTQARTMLDEAQNLQRRARNAATEGNPRLALELTEKARTLAMRGLRLVSSAGNKDNVERALALTDQLLERAKEIAAERGSRHLAQRVEQAARLQSEAHERFRQGDYERALRMTMQARDMLKDALGDAAGDLDRSEVERALQATDEVLARAKQEVAEAHNDLAASVLQRAEAKQRRAWEDFQQDRLRPALANTRVARRLALRAVAIVHGDEF